MSENKAEAETATKHNNTRKSSRGFTLVEISMVLVILGLLVGGTLVGTDLIHAAELRKVTAEFNEFSNAVTTFKTRYNGLPGDMRDATTYWDEADATPLACTTTDSTGERPTCNGNGDGIIGLHTDAATAYERYRFWQHLSNAELIVGSYSGIRGSGGDDHVAIGVNAPASLFGGGGWSIYHLGDRYTDGLWFDGSYGNAFVFGTEDPAKTSQNVAAVASPEDAYNIDQKIDDGLPSTGILTVRYSAPGTDCHDGTAQTDDSTTYKATEPAVVCTLLFTSGF